MMMVVKGRELQGIQQTHAWHSLLTIIFSYYFELSCDAHDGESLRE